MVFRWPKSIYRWFTEVNSMVDLSRANCDSHNQMGFKSGMILPSTQQLHHEMGFFLQAMLKRSYLRWITFWALPHWKHLETVFTKNMHEVDMYHHVSSFQCQKTALDASYLDVTWCPQLCLLFDKPHYIITMV